jgi:uncharacterized C2H2 Zn-finger protein
MKRIKNITVEEAPANIFPQCPFCKMDLDKIWVKSSGLGIRGKQEMLMCPHCHSFLGYSAWKR